MEFPKLNPRNSRGVIRQQIFGGSLIFDNFRQQTFQDVAQRDTKVVKSYISTTTAMGRKRPIWEIKRYDFLVLSRLTLDGRSVSGTCFHEFTFIIFHGRHTL